MQDRPATPVVGNTEDISDVGLTIQLVGLCVEKAKKSAASPVADQGPS